MNKTYKSIFNESTGAYVAVSETAKSKTKGAAIVSACLLTLSASVSVSAAPATSMVYLYGTADNGSVQTIGGVTGLPTTGTAAGNAVEIGNKAQALAEGSIALGYSAKACPSGSDSDGDGSIDCNKAIAIGYNASATGIGAIANGYGATASAYGAIASGINAIASNQQAIAIGTNAKATKVSSTAIGNNTTASGASSTAIGYGSTASNNASLSVGYIATASGNNSLSLGYISKASGDYSIASGYYSKASGTNSVSIGNQAQATGVNSISIGTKNIVTGESSGAIGEPTTINGAGTYGVGNDNGTIDANNSGVFGNDNTITGALDGVRVIGNTNTVSANGAMVMGNSATVSAADGVALGSNTSVTQAGGVALGSGSVANTAAGIAGYVPTNATKAQSDAIAATMATKSAVDVGSRQITSVAAGTADDDAVNVSQLKAVTAAAAASGVHYYSVNDGGATQANYNNDGATGFNSLAAGVGASSTKQNAVSVGAESIADKESSVALGAKSTTATNATKESSAKLNGLTYETFAGQVTDPGMQVSVGADKAERQIKNVGSGAISATSTDAINGSQLYATNEVLGNVANSTKNILGGDAALNPNGTLTMTNIGNTGKNTIHDAIAASQEEVVAGTNIASVVKTTDATTGVDTFTVNAKGTTASAGSTAVTVTSKAGANNVTDYVVDLSDETKQSLVDADTALQTVITQIDGVEVKQLTKDDNTANFVTGKNITLTDDGLGGIEVATADNVTFTEVNTTNLNATGVTNLGGTTNITGDAYYTGPITNGDNIVNKTYVDNSVNVLADTPLNFAGNTGDAIAKKLGETLTISGELAEGENATGANLRVDSADGKLNLVMAKNLTDLNGIAINGGPTINNQGITNLVAGEVSATSTDAVNGSQLYAVSQTANAGWNIATDSGAAAASNVKPSDTVNFNGDGNVVVSNVGNDVTVGLADKVTIGKGGTAVTIDGTNGTIQAGGVTINGDKGTVNGLSNTTWDANNIVKGQAATEDQLKVVADNVTAAVGAAKTEVEAGKNVFVSSKPGDKGQTVYTVATKDEVDFNKVTVGGLTIDKTKVDVAGNTIISGVGKGELSSTSTDAVNGSQLYATNQNVTQNTTDITNINTTLDKGLNFSADSGSTVNRKLGDTVAITGDGNITTTTTANGVQLKLSDNIDVKNVKVSESITVAEGAKVDMGGNVIQNVAPGVNGTDAVNVNQVNAVAGNLNNRINRVGHIANAGVAQAIATAGLPQAYLPGKSMMAVAGGTYEGETGYAIGFSTISDNGKWIIKVTGSGNSRDKYGASLGAGYQW